MKFLHFSDLHWGRKFSPSIAYTIREFIKKENFKFILISGDLTQRAKKREFLAVKRYLDSLEVPYISVPGNHDIPLYPIHFRFLAPFYKYKRYFSNNLEPEIIDKKFCFFGISTAHSFTGSEGRIKIKQIKKLRIKLLRTSPSQFIFLIMHHPLIYSDPSDRDRTIWGSASLINLFMEVSPDIILSGHFHNRFFYNLRDFYPKLSKDVYIFFTSKSTNERGRKKEIDLSGFNIIELKENSLQVKMFLVEDEKIYQKEVVEIFKS